MYEASLVAHGFYPFEMKIYQKNFSERNRGERRTSFIVLVFSSVHYTARNTASNFPYAMLMINVFVVGFHYYCHYLNITRS